VDLIVAARVLAEEPYCDLGDRDRVGGVDTPFGERRSVRFLAGVTGVEVADGEARHAIELARRRMHHESGVDAVEPAALHHEDLAAAAFLRRRAEDRTVMPRSSATLASPRAAPTAADAITLWPQAWPISGRASYSAHMATVSGPVPALAANAVRQPADSALDAKPPSVSASAHQLDACSSSKPSSGCSWIIRESPISRSAAFAIVVRACCLAASVVVTRVNL